MKRLLLARTLPLLLLPLLATAPAATQTVAPAAAEAAPSATDERTPLEVFNAALETWAEVVEPAADEPIRCLTGGLHLVASDLLPEEIGERRMSFAWQAPDHLRLDIPIGGDTYSIGRAGEELWIHAPATRFGAIGRSAVARFSATPDDLDATSLAPVSLPIEREQLALAAVFLEVEAGEPVAQGHSLLLTPTPAALSLGVPEGELELWLTDDLLPARVRWIDDDGDALEVAFEGLSFSAPPSSESWDLTPGPDDTIEIVALSHLTRFVGSLIGIFGDTLPTLGPATGSKRVLARSGAGRLEEIDGTRVLFLEGTPEEIGRQHGELLREEARHLVERIVFGFGIGSSFAEGRWFLGELEEALSRVLPFTDERYLREMDAMADAVGLSREEVRLANFFPELFHCSGFALFGEATADGTLYHGRVLDYLRGVGLEQNAVVMVIRPDEGHAWVNVGYAGFTGTVTAMNERQIGLGEMGGRGEGDWDGKPMAQLMREVMEKADSLDDVIEIMGGSARTCEYYYVASDGKTNDAIGIAATPEVFEVIRPGQFHEQLARPVRDCVLMSAGGRYETLVDRAEAGYGKFDATSAMALMESPVCMTSNIHSVLFAPASLDFWVANADDANPAAHTRYTHYNLTQLLESGPPEPASESPGVGTRSSSALRSERRGIR
ncbi:MAG TPA: C45 family autoproteolytic acyltransferase/hydrolase [Planctomycetota bacterium]|nr:C45 family autoproteolytic acyltransferase/hydrolase [Planctomycetota bacterium]